MIKFPFTSFQQFNLDWIMQQLRKILDFMPQNGVAGDVLQRTADGAAWQPITAISLDIHALNPMTDHVAGNDELPIYDNSLQGNYKISVYDLMDLAPVQSVNGMTGDILLNIPAVPVDSVNGQTGDVILSAADVGALPDTTVIPDSTSDLINDSGYVNAAGAAAAAPVQSVNGQTGAVVLDADDVGALPDTYVAPVTSVNGQTGDVVVGGGSSPTLLWTNSSPVASFAQQTVTLDLSGYSFVLIEYICSPGGFTDTRCDIFPVPTITPLSGYTSDNSIFGVYLSGSTVLMGKRFFEITTSGIAFGWGSRISALNSSSTSDDTMCRPTRIWGIA